jgi:hypothetical protein
LAVHVEEATKKVKENAIDIETDEDEDYDYADWDPIRMKMKT